MSLQWQLSGEPAEKEIPVNSGFVRRFPWSSFRVLPQPLRRLLPFAAAVGGGLLLALAFPPVHIDFLAWIAFVPLFWALNNEARPGWAFLYGTAFGIAFFLVDVRWTYGTMILHGHFAPYSAGGVFVGLVLTLALFPAAFALGLCLAARKGFRPSLAAPFLWTCTEYLRTVAFTGFPWDLVGYSQFGRLILLQVADLTGVYGISFLVLLVNAALWEIIRTRGAGEAFPARLVSVVALMLVLTLGYGAMRMREFPNSGSTEPNVVVGVLQGNIPQDIKWEAAARYHTFAAYERLGLRAREQGARLLVWPETAAPVLFGSRDEDWKRPGEISSRLGVPMLVGAPSTRTMDSHTHYFNSAFLIDAGMLRFRYDKIHLVPFGEYMPLSWLLPLGPGIAARDADYSPGDKMTVMSFPGLPHFSVLICYEAIFPELARLALSNGATLLVNITNDGWFGDSAAPYQHLAMAGMRSIENRVWLVRAANTGVSAAFDPAGRMVASIPLQEEGMLTVAVPESPRVGCFYSRFGDLFAWSCVLACILLAVSAGAESRKSRIFMRLKLPPDSQPRGGSN